MPSKPWLDSVEKIAKQMAQGPNKNEHSSSYWTHWGSVMREYVEIVTPQAVLELVEMAKKTTSVLIPKDTSDDKRFERTEYVIEATTDERDNLWNIWAKEAQEFARIMPPEKRVEWEQDLMRQVYVGKIGTHDIVVTYFWMNINRSSMVFWEATSMVVDYDLIEQWNKQHFPKARLFETSTNFRNCLREQEERRAKHKK